MSKFLHPTHRAAIAVCDRCKEKKPYNDLQADGDKPGLRVCMDGCCDVKDPWKLPRPREKPITLRYARPDISLTVPGGHIISNGDMGGFGYICTEDGLRIKVG